MSRTKILFFIVYLGCGGAERSLINLISTLDPQKFDITLATLFDYGEYRNLIPENVRYKPYFSCKPFHGFSYLLRAFSPKFWYKKTIKGKYDIVIAFLENCSTRIISGCDSVSTRKFAWIHGMNLDKKTYRSLAEQKKCYENFDKIAFVSEDARTNFIKEHPDFNISTDIITNIINQEHILKSSGEHIEFELDKNLINLCYVGRLTPIKGLSRLLDALNIVNKNKQVNWHLYIIGEGEQKPELISRVYKYGLSNNITFLGYKDNPYKYISKMDLLICPSYSEGFGLAPLESLALGVPVLSTKIPALENNFNENNGVVITENNDESFLYALEKLISEKEYIKRLTISAQKNKNSIEYCQSSDKFLNFIG